MNNNLGKKTVCLILILALVLTTLAASPVGFAGSSRAEESYTIDGMVLYTIAGDIPELVPVATVVLYDLQTGTQVTGKCEDGYFIFQDVRPGHYQVIAKPSNNNFLSTNKSRSSILEVEDDLTIKLYLQKVPLANPPYFTLNGIIRDENNVLVPNAWVTLKSTHTDYIGYSVTSENTNGTGGYELESFRGPYELWATAMNFSYYINESVYLSGPMTINITLNSSVSRISGDISFNPRPEGQIEKTVILYDITNNEYIYQTTTGYFFTMKAYHGRFNLIIDSPGYEPYYYPEVIELNTSTNSFAIQDTMVLEETNDEKILTKITFRDNDWNKLAVDQTWTLNHDTELYGLEFVDYGDPITIGCPRFQIDMEPAFGGSVDGIDVGTIGKVEDNEMIAFEEWLDDRGPYHVYTDNSFKINDTYFGWDKASFQVASTSGFVGQYTSDDEMEIQTDVNYNSILDEDNDGEDEKEPLAGKSFKIWFGNLRENEVIKFTLPSGYEFSNAKTYDTEKVWIISSRICQVNDTVTVFAGKLEDPTAMIKVTKDYVGILKDITFNGSTSEPGSGVIVNYTWDFGADGLKYGSAVEHNFTSPGVKNITLTVKTSAELFDETWQEIKVDNMAPQGDIRFENETGVVIDVGIENTQEAGYLIYFNASGSTDKLSKDPLPAGQSNEGIITSYYWLFGDAQGTSSNKKIAEHSYDHPGFYTVTLNISDAAGNYKVIEEILEIKDIEAPVPKLITDPVGRTLYMDGYIILNASTTKDNYDPLENLTFWWDLDANVDSGTDGILNNDDDVYGAIVNFSTLNFGNKISIRPGPHPIALWVKDKEENIGNSTILPPPEWTLDIAGTDLSFEPIEEEVNKFIDVSDKKPTEGEKVKFKVNITNDGMVTAKNVVVNFFIDGKLEGSKDISSLERNDHQIVTFTWKASGVEKHNITFNVTLQNTSFEHTWDNNEVFKFMEVHQETFIDTSCLIVIVVIVIIVIVVIIYFYKRRREEAEFTKRRSDKGKGKKEKGKDKGKEKSKGKSKKKEK